MPICSTEIICHKDWYLWTKWLSNDQSNLVPCKTRRKLLDLSWELRSHSINQPSVLKVPRVVEEKTSFFVGYVINLCLQNWNDKNFRKIKVILMIMNAFKAALKWLINNESNYQLFSKSCCVAVAVLCFKDTGRLEHASITKI